MRFTNTQLVLFLGLALIGCSAGAADVAVKDTAAAVSQPPNVICEQKPAPKRKTVIHTPPKPSAQSNEVYVYCGEAGATQNSTPPPANGKGLPPKPDDSKANTPDEDKQASKTYKAKIGLKDLGIEIESPNPLIFLGAILLVTVLAAGLVFFVARQAKSERDSKGKKALIVLVVIGGLAAIAYIAYVYAIKQPSPAEYRAEVEKAISAADLEEKVARKIDPQLRAELQQCTRAWQEGEVRIHVLEATTESWPFTRGTPYWLFGAAVGLFAGMLICIPLVVLLLVRRSRYRSDPLRDHLLDELQKELVEKEIETIREILRQRRDKNP